MYLPSSDHGSPFVPSHCGTGPCLPKKESRWCPAIGQRWHPRTIPIVANLDCCERLLKVRISRWSGIEILGKEKCFRTGGRSLHNEFRASCRRQHNCVLHASL